MRISGVVSITVCYVLLLFSLFWSFIFLVYPDSIEWNGINLLNQSNIFGVCSTLTGLIAITILIFKMRRKRRARSQSVRQASRYFHQHHVIFGITTVATSLAHGIYYIPRPTDLAGKEVTGWGAFVFLAFLAVLGLTLFRKRNALMVRVVHRWFGILFTFVVFLHAGGWQLTILAVTVLALLVLRIFKSVINMS